MNRYRLITIALFALLLCACNSVHHLQLNTYRPAQVEYHMANPSVVVVNNSEKPDSREDSRYIDENGKVFRLSYEADSIASHFAMAVGQGLYDSNCFETVEVLYPDSSQIRGLMGLDPEMVQAWQENYPNEVYLSINYLQPRATMKVHRYEGYFGTEIKVAMAAQVQHFIPGESAGIVIFTDSLNWIGYGETPTISRYDLPPFEECIEEALYNLSTKAIQYYSPHERTVERYLFVTGHPAMQDAYRYWSNKQIDEASYLWEYVYEEAKNEGRRAKAAINLALYYELKDNYQEALKYAQAAYDLFTQISNNAEAEYARRYATDLQQRIEEEVILNRYMM